MATVRAPNPLWWLYYQYGGRLPARYRDWVLRDGTCRTWLLRVLVRGLVLIAPMQAALFIILRLFGISWYLALGALVLGVLVSVRYSLSYAVESVDTRLSRHGYPDGCGSEVRRRAYDEAHAGDAERYRVAWRSGGE
ncbi:MAG TPA: DUF5313 family protein [Pseudonocardiaceae bacterium]|jgi:hypothetical protein|nr:DUF5313 family protein [Pseudonocardiaceae bacterium]